MISTNQISTAPENVFQTSVIANSEKVELKDITNIGELQTTWNREKSRIKRMKGEEYLGYTRSRASKLFHNKIRPPKTIGPPSTVMKCIKFKYIVCNTINFEKRFAQTLARLRIG